MNFTYEFCEFRPSLLFLTNFMLKKTHTSFSNQISRQSKAYATRSSHKCPFSSSKLSLSRAVYCTLLSIYLSTLLSIVPSFVFDNCGQSFVGEGQGFVCRLVPQCLSNHCSALNSRPIEVTHKADRHAFFQRNLLKKFFPRRILDIKYFKYIL